MIKISRLLSSIRKQRQIYVAISVVYSSKTHNINRYYCQNATQNDLVKKDLTSTTEQEEHYEENIKNKILEQSLQFVPNTGWSMETLSSGAEAAGYPGISHGLFPNDGGDLINYFNLKCNKELVEHMKSWSRENIKGNKIPSKFVTNAIMTRIIMIEPYKKSWPKAMALQALPSNIPNSLASLLSLVDDICYYSGEQSADFNWYMRRVGLASIYKAAELFYLTDNSQDNSATKDFLKSRIRDAQLVQDALNINPVSVVPQAFTAGFTTAKNILGINALQQNHSLGNK